MSRQCRPPPSPTVTGGAEGVRPAGRPPPGNRAACAIVRNAPVQTARTSYLPSQRVTGARGIMNAVGVDLPGFADFEEIGRGGFGVVYRARELALDRHVAVKFLPAAAMGESTRKRF